MARVIEFDQRPYAELCFQEWAENARGLEDHGYSGSDDAYRQWCSDNNVRPHWEVPF